MTIGRSHPRSVGPDFDLHSQIAGAAASPASLEVGHKGSRLGGLSPDESMRWQP